MELLKKSNGNLARTPEEIEQMIDNAADAYAGFLNAVGFDYTADRQTVGALLLFSGVMSSSTA